MDKSEQKQMEGYGEAVGMNRAMLDRMQKALNYVRKNGPIAKAETSAKKRKLEDTPSPSGSKSAPHVISEGRKVNTSKSSGKGKVEVIFDFESDEYKKILNAKSKHESLLEEVQQEEYFEKLEKKEAIENKMLSTFAIATNAVMCRECKYVALGQSDYCKEKRHQIRVVKATKRFFKCKDCGNRTMSLDRLPKLPCKVCKNTSWLAAPVGKERKGPVLESEVLSIRGDEETFLGSSSGKLFLNI
jgi:minichromosome maintenance protein 10